MIPSLSASSPPLSFQSLDFHLLVSPLVASHLELCIANPKLIPPRSFLDLTRYRRSACSIRVRSSERFFTSLQPVQCDLYPPQMNDERKPRAVCRSFIYLGFCDNMQCPRAHVPHQNMVRSVVTHAPHSLHNLTCFFSALSLNFF